MLSGYSSSWIWLSKLSYFFCLCQFSPKEELRANRGTQNSVGHNQFVILCGRFIEHFSEMLASGFSWVLRIIDIEIRQLLIISWFEDTVFVSEAFCRIQYSARKAYINLDNEIYHYREVRIALKSHCLFFYILFLYFSRRLV